ncbi:hypothetical protein LXA43DRAFT_1067461 [Ganoderma leucocontextum]|nr:hypothetical protein LXA43DRAFT_1067461 [Ganoderma leucocontextum]
MSSDVELHDYDNHAAHAESAHALLRATLQLFEGQDMTGQTGTLPVRVDPSKESIALLLLTLDMNDAYFRLLQKVIDVLLAYMEKERERASLYDDYKPGSANDVEIPQLDANTTLFLQAGKSVQLHSGFQDSCICSRSPGPVMADSELPLAHVTAVGTRFVVSEWVRG